MPCWAPLFGFALGLALLRSAEDLIEPANGPAFLTAFVVAMFLFGYLAIPYVTIYPARRAAEKLSEVGAGEFALGVAPSLIGLVMGLLIGVPLAQLGGAAGSLLPPIVAIFLAAMMLSITPRSATSCCRRSPASSRPRRRAATNRSWSTRAP